MVDIETKKNLFFPIVQNCFLRYCSVSRLLK